MEERFIKLTIIFFTNFFQLSHRKSAMYKKKALVLNIFIVAWLIEACRKMNKNKA
jgi:hypothetical protein